VLKYIIVFDKPVRMPDGNLVEAIGPFKHTGKAMDLWAELKRPPGVIRAIWEPLTD
jgi:hypothetical protein